MKKLETGGNFLIDKNIVSAVLALIILLLFRKSKPGRKKASFFKRYIKAFSFIKGAFTSFGILKTKQEIKREQKEDDFPVKIEQAILFDI